MIKLVSTNLFPSLFAFLAFNIWLFDAWIRCPNLPNSAFSSLMNKLNGRSVEKRCWAVELVQGSKAKYVKKICPAAMGLGRLALLSRRANGFDQEMKIGDGSPGVGFIQPTKRPVFKKGKVCQTQNRLRRYIHTDKMYLSSLFHQECFSRTISNGGSTQDLRSKILKDI